LVVVAVGLLGVAPVSRSGERGVGPSHRAASVTSARVDAAEVATGVAPATASSVRARPTRAVDLFLGPFSSAVLVAALAVVIVIVARRHPDLVGRWSVVTRGPPAARIA
jgi:hypothetical protein